MLGPDEPRYAAIGKAMAATGDWVTPRLWGHPWFEKPPLLFWMTGAGFRMGLGSDLAPRLPVALLSVAFLLFFFWIIQREFGERAAWFSTAILSTSAGWFAYSHNAVTDLPLSVFFAAAMLLLLSPGLGRAALAGLFLGLAVLAKALVPLVLFLPAVWFLRRRPRELALLSGVCALVALPWFALCYLRNGPLFTDDLIWKQHFSRFATSGLQHVQPFWYFAPVLLCAIFPWTPLAILLFKKNLYANDKIAFIASWLIFGFVFFSTSRNKLPGYLLPLLPALAILIGIAFSEARQAGTVLGLAALLTGLTPAIRALLPQALNVGITHVSFHLPLAGFVFAACAAGLCFWLERRGMRPFAFAIPAVLMATAYGQFLSNDLPSLDRSYSARPVWQAKASVSKAKRTLMYGLCYYADGHIPDCPEK